MTCPEPETLLQYVDDAASPTTIAEITHHMHACHTCRRTIRTLRTLTDHLTQMRHTTGAASATVTGCVDTVLLAAYVDQRLTPWERRRVEQHMSSCQDCSQLVQDALQRLEDVEAALHPVPTAVLDKAAALGTRRRAAEPPLWMSRLQDLRQWVVEGFPQPQGAWAWGGVAVAASLVLMVAVTQWHQRPASEEQVARVPQHNIYGFGVATDVQFTGHMPLSPAVRNALIAYNAAPTSADTRQQLLTVLGQAPLKLPDAQVHTIEVKPALRRLADRTDMPTLQVTLLQDGLLTIGEMP